MNNSTETQFIELKVPKIFFTDHRKRGCVEYSGNPEQYIVNENKVRITVRLDPRDVAELMSDAEYYGSKYGFDRSVTPDICSSATSTVNALMRQGVARVNLGWVVK
jgi:hypothetical protein